MRFNFLSLRLAKFAAAALLPFACVAFAQNAAVVNNKPIPTQKVDEFVAALIAQGRPDSPQLRAAVREELIARELFVQEAEKKGLQRNADVQRQLDAARQDILIRALIRDYMTAHPVTDDEVAAEYERVKKESAGKEYHVRHILVETEDEAKKIIDQLEKGTSFAELAKEHSKDTGSAQNGGDLDWNTPQTFVKEFSDAMVKLDKGQFTKTPVKTEFGYHVIELEDVRDAQAPPLEQVKPQIRQELERARVQQLQKDLRAKATIK